LKGVKDNDPINLLTILESNGLEDALWTLRATTENHDKVAQLMAADFAEEVLPIWQKYSQDKRPQLAIQASRDFAHGRTTLEQRDVATATAWDATRTATRAAAGNAARATAAAAAGDAAWAATWAAAAAGATAEAKQKKIFVRYLQPKVQP
jgi:hypothetical protein